MENQEFQKTINYIFDLIENGMLQLGDKLPTERAISAKLGVSRNFVREAIRSLESLGLVECRQGSGNYLADNIKESIAKSVNLMLLTHKVTRKEVFEFRRVMDKTICSYIIKNGMSTDSKAAIRDTLSRMENAATRTDEMLADRDFHYALLHATGNRLWIALIEAVSQTYQNWIESLMLAAESEIIQQITASHEKIFNSIIEKNIPVCMNAVDEHYDIIDDIHI